MSDVKRYGMSGFGGGIIELPDGHLVHIDDYDALQAERDQLRAELAAIRGQEPIGFVSEIGMERVKTGRSGAIAKSTTGRRCIPLYALPPQQHDAVSVPRELAERLEARMAECNPMKEHWDTLEELRALLSTRQAEEGE